MLLLKKIKIKNFKSIQEIEFEIKKYGASYTTMFLGVNESGKSNILQAMSFLEAPEGDFDYLDYHNQKDESDNPVDLWFSFDFESKDTCVKELRNSIQAGGELLNFEICNIAKNVSLERGDNAFYEAYEFNTSNLTDGLFIKVSKKNVTNATTGKVLTTNTYEISKTAVDENYVLLDIPLFEELFKEEIILTINKFEPNVTFWKPSHDYLISTEDLISFAQTPDGKPALKNIFLLAGYKTEESIKEIIDQISNGQRRSRLVSKLQESLDNYIKNVWKHSIDIVIDITETGKFTLSIKDSGEKNIHDRLPINGRSEGARHFLSLILSLSIESNHGIRCNQLILIDEPEVHLHPSGIRDLRDELLKIGENNYLFISTHSPFLVDKIDKQRNIIIKKNSDAKTEKKLIEHYSDSLDDEVLYEAFGLDVYKDLLRPHSILVEGASDKTIIQKAFDIKDKANYGITNGHGSNVVMLAAKLNETIKSILVILDDDKDGKSYKNKIIKFGGSYSNQNVVTVKDLAGSLADGSTIEDLLGKNYVQKVFTDTYKVIFTERECEIDLDEAEPFVKQMKVYLQQKSKQDIDEFIEQVKSKLADDFNPSKGTFDSKFPLLNSMINRIIEILNQPA